MVVVVEENVAEEDNVAPAEVAVERSGTVAFVLFVVAAEKGMHQTGC